MRVEFSRRAEAHLERLRSYLSTRFYPESASRFVDRLIDYCDSLSETPQIGSHAAEYGNGVRAVSFERKVAIYFKVEPTRLVILGVFYRGRVPY